MEKNTSLELVYFWKCLEPKTNKKGNPNIPFIKLS